MSKETTIRTYELSELVDKKNTTEVSFVHTSEKARVKISTHHSSESPQRFGCDKKARFELPQLVLKHIGS